MDREHVPDRPTWHCWACGHPWPCGPARKELFDAFYTVGLAMFTGERLVEAAHDLPTVSPEELFERFLAWTRIR